MLHAHGHINGRRFDVYPVRVGNVRETFASGVQLLKVQIKRNNYNEVFRFHHRIH